MDFEGERECLLPWLENTDKLWRNSFSLELCLYVWFFLLCVFHLGNVVDT